MHQDGEKAWHEAMEGEAAAEDDDADAVSRSSGDESEVASSSSEGEAVGPGDAASGGDVVANKGGCLTPAQAETFQTSVDRTGIFTKAIEELSRVGALAAAACLQNECAKERRRLRTLCREDPAVAGTLLARQEREGVEHREEQRRLQEVNENQLTLKHLQQKIASSKDALKKRKAEVMQWECLLESKHALKRFTPAFLGDGQRNNGGAKAQKARFEVMDRLARLGTGLTQSQQNDWTWFKSAWDEKMSLEHPLAWGGVFAGWMQKVIEDLHETANAFSTFIRDETQRCFHDEVALCL
jgi:hypothetical protein